MLSDQLKSRVKERLVEHTANDVITKLEV